MTRGEAAEKINEVVAWLKTQAAIDDALADAAADIEEAWGYACDVFDDPDGEEDEDDDEEDENDNG